MSFMSMMVKHVPVPPRWIPLVFPVLLVFSSGPLAPGQDDVPAAQDNVVVVIDASGSMKTPMQRGSGQSRMEAAKGALLEVMKRVPATASVGVLVFSGRDRQGKPITNDWIYPLGPIDAERLRSAIEEPRPAGNTPLGRYLKKGTDRLLAQRAAQNGYGTYRLLVVTDGEASDPELLERHLPDVLSRGVSVDVIGVDMQQAHALATRVHSYRSANDPDSLTRAVSEVFAEIGSQDPVATEEAFAVVSGLPDGMAEGVITALTEPRNQPIGARAVPPPPATPGEGATPRRSAAPSKDGGEVVPGPPVSGRLGFFEFVAFVVVAGFIFFIVMIVVSVRMTSKRRRS